MATVSETLHNVGWTPAEFDRPAEIPRVRAGLEIAAKQQVDADIALSVMRSSDAVMAATDNFNNQITRLIDALKPKRRPLFISFNADALPDDKDVPVWFPHADCPPMLERAFILPGAAPGSAPAVSGSIEVRIRNLLAVDFSVFGSATNSVQSLDGHINLPVDLPRQMNCKALAVGAATGVWHLVLVFADASNV